MAISRIDRELFAASWPVQHSVENIEFLNGEMLLVCGGFEDRAMAVLNMAEKSKCQGLTVLDFEYLPKEDSNHFQQISKLCDYIGWKHIRVEYDRCNPSGIFGVVANHFPKNLKRLYLDISGMSRLLIVQLIVGLLKYERSDWEVSILYTEAEIYPPSESEALAKLSNNINDSSSMLSFISTGVYDIAIVPELSSLSVSRAPLGLIAFPSFNPAQLFSAQSIIQPAKTALINGIPPDPALSWRAEAICKMNQITDEPKDHSINVSTLDYSECLKALLSIYDQWSEFNSIVLSPTGSKMQTVAVGIFRGFVQDVQIIYPTPLRFTNPTQHTQGAKQMYEVNLTPFIELNKSY